MHFGVKCVMFRMYINYCINLGRCAFVYVSDHSRQTGQIEHIRIVFGQGDTKHEKHIQLQLLEWSKSAYLRILDPTLVQIENAFTAILE